MLMVNKTKNFLINGAMDFWQRGTSVYLSSLLPSTYLADRFIMAQSGFNSIRCMQSAMSSISLNKPISGSNKQFNYAMNILTESKAIAATDYITMSQKVESVLISSLIEKKVTLSFYVLGTAGKYAIYIKNGNGSKSFVHVFDVLQSNVWERKSVTFDLPISDANINRVSGTGIEVGICVAGGSNYHAPFLDQWLSGNYMSHSSCLTTLSTNNLNITGLQLEEGTEASAFERFGSNYLADNIACKRYFYRTDDPYSTFSSSGMLATGHLAQGNTNTTPATIKFPMEMRTTPLITFYSNRVDVGKDGSITKYPNYVSSNVSVDDNVAPPSVYTSKNGFNCYYSAANWVRFFNYQADAEL